MRADRLVSVLLLLQSRGKVTAAEVATELEISERTARRDLEALGLAGLPVYPCRGRHGGWQLAGTGRTDLSGLTAPEARALFLLVGAAPATPEVKQAVRKLMRALPEPFRAHAEAATTAVVVEPAGWDRRRPERLPPPHLEPLQAAVVEGEAVHLGYVDRAGTATVRLAHPLGLAAKGPTWYLVAGTASGLRTFRVDRVTSVERAGVPAERPDGFDLGEAWAMITGKVEELRAPLLARALADPAALGWCRETFGTRVRIGPAQPDGRVELEIRGHNPRYLAAEIAGFGRYLEVLGPPEVRQALADVGTELVARYR